MRPISFTCRRSSSKSPKDLCEAIADVNTWNTFKGTRFLPGVESAHYEQRESGMVGSIIRVKNTDGSSHIERVTRWDAGVHVEMRLEGFSPPLCRFAAHFTEKWNFVNGDISRRLQLFPTSVATRPFLWLISRLLRSAVDRHLRQIA